MCLLLMKGMSYGNSLFDELRTRGLVCFQVLVGSKNLGDLQSLFGVRVLQTCTLSTVRGVFRGES